MNYASALIRIIVGLGLIVFTIVTWRENSGNIEAGETPQIMGKAIDLTGGALTAVFAVFGLFGLALIVLGIVKLLQKP